MSKFRKATMATMPETNTIKCEKQSTNILKTLQGKSQVKEAKLKDQRWDNVPNTRKIDTIKNRPKSKPLGKTNFGT